MAMVTAGFKCAPLYLLEQATPTKTAIPQPKVITIHPAPFPLVRLNSPLATTPLPTITRIAVPINSARNGFIRLSFPIALCGAGFSLQMEQVEACSTMNQAFIDDRSSHCLARPSASFQRD